ncbi:hypothetical protein DI005_25245 [Prauserella sp. PE36]|uniref:hypothetical protein n=1 Tax=Prauserella sp. PE36 TaxID=1504709 RepID=UPI000DE1CA8B|nr:hypothetical protein [Prauserella sp. PE36]RBM16594.1 hypothetical protein DI005_25245 [Prauserella sp. PE36]
MSSPTVEQLAEVEQRYQELKARAEAEQAERARREAERQAERARLTPEFWAEQRHTFLDRHRGQVESAWRDFETAVRAGQPGVAEWTAYRSAVKWRHLDKLTIDTYFVREAGQAYEQRATDAQRLQAVLRRCLTPHGDKRVADNMGMELQDFRQMRDEATKEASRLLGREFASEHKGVLAALHALPDYVGTRPATAGLASFAEQNPAPHGARTYAEAVSQVTEQQAREAVQQQQDQRQAALADWLNERVPQVG